MTCTPETEADPRDHWPDTLRGVLHPNAAPAPSPTPNRCTPGLQRPSYTGRGEADGQESNRVKGTGACQLHPPLNPRRINRYNMYTGPTTPENLDGRGRGCVPWWGTRPPVYIPWVDPCIVDGVTTGARSSRPPPKRPAPAAHHIKLRRRPPWRPSTRMHEPPPRWFPNWGCPAIPPQDVHQSARTCKDV